MAGETRLPAFLNDIDASELSSKPVEEAIYARHRARVEQEIGAVKLRILQCLRDNRAAIDRQKAATLSLTSRLQVIERDLEDIDHQVHDPVDGLEIVLLSSLQQHNTLQKEVLAKQTTVAALKDLREFQESLSRIKSAQQAVRLKGAVDELLAAEVALQGAAGWLKKQDSWRKTQAQLEDLRSALGAELHHLCFERAFELSQDGLQTDETLAPMKDHFAALEQLGLLEAPLARTNVGLLDRFIRPLLTDWSTILNETSGVLSVVRSSSISQSPAKLEPLIRKISAILGRNLSSKAANQLKTGLIDPMLQTIVDKVLMTALPATLDLEQLQRYDGLIKDCVAFEQYVLDQSFAASPIITNWTKEVHSHWVHKVSERVIGVIREVVVKAQWETVVVESRAPKPKRRSARSRQQTPEAPDGRAASLSPSASTSISPIQSIAAARSLHVPMPLGNEVQQSHIEADGDFSDDAWGFDAGQTAATTTTTTVQSAPAALPNQSDLPAEVGDDAWGFEADQEEPRIDVQPSSAVPPPVQEEGDAWGFNAEPGQMADTDPLPPSGRPSHGRGDSLSGWGWDEESLVEPVAVPAPLKVGKGRLGAQKVNGVAHKPKSKPSSASSPVIAAELSGSAPDSLPAERYTISTSSKQILSVSAHLLLDAKKLNDVDFPNAVFARAADAVQRSCINVLDFFRATMPVQHAKLFNSVPALGMQFANDCDWLAREIADLDIDGQMEMAFFNLAKTSRENQITAQRLLLSESLDEAAHFRNMADAKQHASAERAVRQVMYTLERLSHVWKPPSLTPSLYNKIMGELVSSVLSRMLREIEDQSDISEADSKRLNELCKTLHSLESLFTEDGRSTIALHVPLWFKFVFLSELLEASLVDIMFLFDEGHLIDFSADELVKLLRALFSESANRAKAIDTIRCHRQPA